MSAELARDRWGRPLVIPRGGGKPVAYTRCTTFVSATEDTTALAKWKQRQVAIGLSMRPDLVALAAAANGDKTELGRICDQAHDAAASSAAANTGTALHQMTEMLDGGLVDIDGIPSDNRADMEAYLGATAGWNHLHIEAFTVLDEYRIGGTPDRIATVPGYGNVIADLKTGSVDYGMGKIAAQLAVYSRSLMYDAATGQRTELPDVRTDVGIVIHLPAGSGTARLLEVDLDAGWANVELCAQVRAWRARKNLAREIAPTLPDDRDELRALWEARPDLRAAIEAKVAAA
jgi:hypothetical protein